MVRASLLITCIQREIISTKRERALEENVPLMPGSTICSKLSLSWSRDEAHFTSNCSFLGFELSTKNKIIYWDINKSLNRKRKPRGVSMNCTCQMVFSLWQAPKATLQKNTRHFWYYQILAGHVQVQGSLYHHWQSQKPVFISIYRKNSWKKKIP